MVPTQYVSRVLRNFELQVFLTHLTPIPSKSRLMDTHGSNLWSTLLSQPTDEIDFGSFEGSIHLFPSGVIFLRSGRSSTTHPHVFNGHDGLRCFGLREFSTLHSSTLPEYFFSRVRKLATPVLTNGWLISTLLLQALGLFGLYLILYSKSSIVLNFRTPGVPVPSPTTLARWAHTRG
jgi:hypothetical protein